MKRGLFVVVAAACISFGSILLPGVAGAQGIETGYVSDTGCICFRDVAAPEDAASTSLGVVSAAVQYIDYLTVTVVRPGTYSGSSQSFFPNSGASWQQYQGPSYPWAVGYCNSGTELVEAEWFTTAYGGIYYGDAAVVGGNDTWFPVYYSNNTNQCSSAGTWSGFQAFSNIGIGANPATAVWFSPPSVP